MHSLVDLGSLNEGFRVAFECARITHRMIEVRSIGWPGFVQPHRTFATYVHTLSDQHQSCW